MAAGNPRIGFIGVGLMGHGIAKNLLAKGFPLTVRAHRNRAPVDDLVAKGANEASSHAELARNAGIILKLINNFVAQAICTATAEACAAAAKSGLSLRKLHELISAGAVNSGLFQMIVGKMLESGDLSGLKFTLSNAAKDLRYYTHFTESMMLPSTIGEAVHQSLVTANALGFGDKYVASLVEAQEKF